ncbi:hypothetical protein E4631_17935 [Hymenobacter sp. UV11]|uniref:hypothetical protein n=1 Tax=Hymenobacter sp. UV11 TaxID=1849735 RepID=UPI0010603EE7|nr:hypothetical protein [Hymenobacter sp. UV11]TDN40183.1 hypothetical protein A8B98_14945 [Hymenobacter sp. UV11]TFZ64868.1 hypothetical protein E4631_17935 [Hymenobacter sp. UV11]
MTDFTFLQRQWLPDRVATAAVGSPAQQAFREAMAAIEALRAQLSTLRAAQAATRQTYWRQVGPVAAEAVAARRALYAPLELALTEGYLSRAEVVQVMELLVHNAHSLERRFGEDEREILARYAPTLPVPDDEAPPTPPAPEMPTAQELPHEQAAAAARAHRQQRKNQQRASQAQAAETESQSLLQNTKAAYRQLARVHHPDRAAQADAATQQAQTALMQRITAAYAAGDLAALLSLLATSEDPTPTASPESDALLLRYTAALAQQHTQLAQELTIAQRPVEDAPWSGTEKQQRTRLRQIKRDLRAETDYLAYLVRQLQEPVGLRQLLRELTANGLAGF